MDSRSPERADDHTVAETPEDVAVLYSWANLHGAKYRDFSASRREYRAQLRHRAAEQVREQALLAQAEAEAAASAAESAARRAAEVARNHQADDADSSMRRALREAESAARTAAAERLEAARRAEAAAVAEAAARREEREIAEAHASAQRQAARFAESELRRKAAAAAAVEQQASSENPKTFAPTQQLIPPQPEPRPSAANEEEPASNEKRRYTDHDRQEDLVTAPAQPERRPSAGHSSPRRPQGYHPDDASGVRQIYRGPDSSTFYTSGSSSRRALPLERRAVASASSYESKPAAQYPIPTTRPLLNVNESQAPSMGQRSSDPQVHAPTSRPTQADPPTSSVPINAGQWPPFSTDPAPITRESNDPSPARPTTPRSPVSSRILASSPSPRPVSPFSQALVPSDSTRGRRAQDDFDYQHSQGFPDRRNVPENLSETAPLSSQRSANQADPTGPAWLYAPPAPQATARPITPVQSSVADTLQHSRERVAARWYALKGVFDQPGQEQPEAVPVRQKETRTPVLAVFSLAGGVGKTSLIATVGRALSSMGEKVLLTDTTSHGLLPFYFGASELRQGTVRTFSPPSGSTDAPIYLVSHEIDYKGSDEAVQEKLAEEIIDNGRGTHRILLDLNAASAWLVSRLSRMNPTILVPVAPDMNSVISLQSLEKFFAGTNDGDGRPLQPYYVLNQFDTSLPLHLDVREVMRRQLGDRLLPFVIRRAPAVSEALAEGMTVVDYAPDAPVAEDYINLATWLRTVAAPATAGFRNVRWSER
ncbi:MAG TPA: cellulose synthase operon protein YhjQ/BcsQ [Edaphobacter sp.]|jgi:cellulose synthase operon protein YhjQ|nr:cellulose synthase operon protein YhjQ/BcsQ [Edaphobacter sp.]